VLVKTYYTLNRFTD